MRKCLFFSFESNKGLVINYGEGGGATKWGNRWFETFCTPPPSLLKGGNCLRLPITIWLKHQPPALILPQNFVCPPFSMPRTFSAAPFFKEVKLHLLPPLPFCSPLPPPPPPPPPLPVISDQSLILLFLPTTGLKILVFKYSYLIQGIERNYQNIIVVNWKVFLEIIIIMTKYSFT